MEMQRQSARLISLFVLVTILGLTVFLFSPWHRHNRLSPQPCAFAALEHSAWAEGVAHTILLDTPGRTFVLLDRIVQVSFARSEVQCAAPVRAPPAAVHA